MPCPLIQVFFGAFLCERTRRGRSGLTTTTSHGVSGSEAARLVKKPSHFHESLYWVGGVTLIKARTHFLFSLYRYLEGQPLFSETNVHVWRVNGSTGAAAGPEFIFQDPPNDI